MQLNFRDCTLAKLDALFGLEEVEELPALTEWLTNETQISDIEHHVLENLRRKLELNGRPDGMIASGRRLPNKPYFCFQEYKREIDPNGEPAGQVLAAMLVAQELNEYEHPIYGCYVKGRLWVFLVLQGRQYSLSAGNVATQDDIFTIFKVLRGLKPIIRELI